MKTKDPSSERWESEWSQCHVNDTQRLNDGSAVDAKTVKEILFSRYNVFWVGIWVTFIVSYVNYSMETMKFKPLFRFFELDELTYVNDQLTLLIFALVHCAVCVLGCRQVTVFYSHCGMWLILTINGGFQYLPILSLCAVVASVGIQYGCYSSIMSVFIFVCMLIDMVAGFSDDCNRVPIFWTVSERLSVVCAGAMSLLLFGQKGIWLIMAESVVAAGPERSTSAINVFTFLLSLVAAFMATWPHVKPAVKEAINKREGDVEKGIENAFRIAKMQGGRLKDCVSNTASRTTYFVKKALTYRVPSKPKMKRVIEMDTFDPLHSVIYAKSNTSAMQKITVMFSKGLAGTGLEGVFFDVVMLLLDGYEENPKWNAQTRKRKRVMRNSLMVGRYLALMSKIRKLVPKSFWHVLYGHMSTSIGIPSSDAYKLMSGDKLPLTIADLLSWKGFDQKSRAFWASLLALVSNLPYLIKNIMSAEEWTKKALYCSRALRELDNLEELINKGTGMLISSLESVGLSKVASAVGINYNDRLEISYTLCQRGFGLLLEGETPGTESLLLAKIERLKEQYSHKIKHDPGLVVQRHCAERIVALDELSAKVRGMVKSSSKKPFPYGFALVGIPGTGKTTMVSLLTKLMLARVGAHHQLNEIQPSDAYDSDLHSNTTVYLYDDPGTVMVQHADKVPQEDIVRLMQGKHSPLIKAAVEEKSKVFNHSLIVAVTSNHADAALSQGVTDPGPSFRRIGVFVEVEPNHDKCKYDGTKWLPLESNLTGEPKHLKFRLYRWKPSNGQYVKKPINVGKDWMDWNEFYKWMQNDFKRHFDEQLELLRLQTHSEICEHFNLRASCSQCATATELQASVPGKFVLSRYDAFFFITLPRVIGVDFVARIDYKWWFAFYRFFALYWTVCAVKAVVTMSPVDFMASLLLYGKALLFMWWLDKYRDLKVNGLLDASNEEVRNWAFSTTFICGISVAAFVVGLRQVMKMRIASTLQQTLHYDDDVTVSTEDSEKTIDPIELKKKVKHEIGKGTDEEFAKINFWDAFEKEYPGSSKGGTGTTHKKVTEIVSRAVVRVFFGDITCNGILIKHSVLLLNDHILENVSDGDTFRLDMGKGKTHPMVYYESYTIRNHEADVALLFHAPVYPPVRDITNMLAATPPGAGTQGYTFIKRDISGVVSTYEGLGSRTNTRMVAVKGYVEKHFSDYGTVSLRISPCDGDCGGAYVNHMSRGVVGIHFSGRSLEGNFTFVTRDRIDPLLEKIHKIPLFTRYACNTSIITKFHAGSLELRTPHHKEATKFVTYPGQVHQFGSLERHNTNVSSLEPNPYYERYQLIRGDPPDRTHMPAKLSQFNRAAHKPLTIASSSFGDISNTTAETVIEQILDGVDDVLAETLNSNHWLRIKPLSIEEALYGIESHPLQNGISSSSGGGIPLNSKRSKWMDETGRYNEKVMSDLHLVHERILAGLNTGCIGTATPKDEALDVEKFDENLQCILPRIFYVGPTYLLVMMKMYVGPILDIMRMNPSYFSHAIGVDPGSIHWEYLQREFDDCESDKHIPMDFSSYDLTHSPMTKIICNKIMSILADKIGYSQQEKDILERILNESENLFIQFQGPIVWLLRLWPSGLLTTAQLGSLKTLIVLVSAFVENNPTLNYREHIRIVTLGDDNNSARLLDSNCKWKPDDITKHLLSIGMVATSESKDGPAGYVPRDDVAFLKRTTIYNHALGYRVGVLARRSMMRALCVWSKNDCNSERMHEIFMSILRECVLYGKASFEFEQSCILKFMDEMQWPYGLLTRTFDAWVNSISSNNMDRLPIYATLQMDDRTSGQASTVQNTTTALPGTTEVEEVTTEAYHEIRDPNQYGAEPAPSIGREVEILRLQYGIGLVDQQVFQPFQLLLENEMLKKLLVSTHAIRADLCMRFVVSGSRYQRGAFMASVLPLPTYTDMHSESTMTNELLVCQMSQRPNVAFQVGAEGDNILKMPYMYYLPYMPTDPLTLAGYCSTTVATVTPPVDDQGNGGNVTVIVTAWLENVHVLGNTVVPLQAGAQRIPKERSAKPSTLISGIGKAAAAASAAFPALGVPAELAAGAGMISEWLRILGHSKNLDQEAMPIVPVTTPGFVNYNSDVAGVNLAYDCTQGVSVDPSIAGGGPVDPLVIEDMCNRWSMIGRYLVTPATNGTVFRCNVTPVAPVIDSGGDMVFAACGIPSLFFEKWYGRVCYRLTAVCSDVTGGILAITHDPLGFGREDPDMTRNVTYKMDLKALNTLEIQVPWTSPSQLLDTHYANNFLSPLSSGFSPRHHNGTLSVAILSPIVGLSPSVQVYLTWEVKMLDPFFMTPSLHALARLDIAPRSFEGKYAGASGVGDGLMSTINSQYGQDFTGPVNGSVQVGVPTSTPVRDSVDGNGSNYWQVLTSSNSGPSTAPPSTPAPTRAPSMNPTFAPTQLPSAAETFVPSGLPTFAPSGGPTRAPTGRPTLNTGEPSFSPVSLPTGVPTFSPTLDPCDVTFTSVPVAWAGARRGFNLNSDGDYAGVDGSQFIMETIAWAGVSSNPAIMITIEGELSFSTLQPSNVVTAGNVRSYTFVDSSPDDWISDFKIEGNIVGSAKIVEIQLTLLNAYSLVEYSAAELDSILNVPNSSMTTTFGWNALALTETFSLPWAAPPQNCATPTQSFAAVTWTGQAVENGTGEHAANQSVQNRSWRSSSLAGVVVDPNPTFRLISAVLVVARAPLQGMEDLNESIASAVWEIGPRHDPRDYITRVYAGEHIVTMRAHLKIPRWRISMKHGSGTVRDAREVHMYDFRTGRLNPVEFFSNCFYAVRGGMVFSLYIQGEGNVKVQRGAPVFDSNGYNLDQRGVYIIDSRVNPFGVVHMPYSSDTLFEIGRQANSHVAEFTIRYDTWTVDQNNFTVDEAFHVGEDFSFVGWLGCPVLRVA